MQGGYIRQERPYVTFAALFVSEKREKRKFCIFRVVDGADPYKTKSKYSQQKKQKNMYSIPSARVLDSRPPCIYSGRADNACTNLLGYLV